MDPFHVFIESETYSGFQLWASHTRLCFDLATPSSGSASYQHCLQVKPASDLSLDLFVSSG